jgi:hypothetical protein
MKAPMTMGLTSRPPLPVSPFGGDPLRGLGQGLDAVFTA